MYDDHILNVAYSIRNRQLKQRIAELEAALRLERESGYELWGALAIVREWLQERLPEATPEEIIEMIDKLDADDNVATKPLEGGAS